VKRTVDILVAALGLLLLSPALLMIALAIAFSMGFPVLFRQVRPGCGGTPFTMMKFRTMRILAREAGPAATDAQRITRLGQFLRSTSLDELPELWNVLVGDMSLVGPRPLLMEYLPLYSAHQARRHEVRPGITGWAQVNGRNAISWDQKLALDVWYVDNRSLALDFRVLAMTVLRVVRADGISHAGEATMPRFTGSHTTQHEDG
jgi:lipopolysaccharide/colanic/teichoic acid biosynthesis glycosyltransferase